MINPDVYPIESVRDGWHEGCCPFCGYSTTGLESVVEEAIHDHAATIHPRRYRRGY